MGSLNDDAMFLLLARTLRAGRFALPDGTGLPLTDPLPGFSVLLMLPEKWLAGHWDALRLLSLGISWLCLWTTWRLARRVLPPKWAAAATILVAVNTVFLIHCGVVLPDILYTAVSLWALAELPGKKSAGRLAMLAAAACAAALIRPQGLVLAGALALGVFAQVGFPRACGFAAASLTPAALWALRNRLGAGTATHYLQTWTAGMPQLQSGGQRLHCARLAATLLGEGMLGLIGMPFWALLGSAGAVLALCGYGAARRLGKEQDAAVFAMTVYTAGLLLLHATWSLEYIRYLLPLLPLLWILVLLGARELPAFWPRAAAVLGVVIVLAALRDDLRFLNAQSGRQKTLWPQTMAWVAEHTPPAAQLQSPYYAPLMYFTGRPTIAAFGPLEPEAWLQACRERGVEYEVVDLNFARWSAGTGAGPSKTSPPFSDPRVHEVYRNPEEGSVVLRIERPRGS